MEFFKIGYPKISQIHITFENIESQEKGDELPVGYGGSLALCPHYAALCPDVLSVRPGSRKRNMSLPSGKLGMSPGLLPRCIAIPLFEMHYLS